MTIPRTARSSALNTANMHKAATTHYSIYCIIYVPYAVRQVARICCGNGWTCDDFCSAHVATRVIARWEYAGSENILKVFLHRSALCHHPKMVPKTLESTIYWIITIPPLQTRICILPSRHPPPINVLHSKNRNMVIQFSAARQNVIVHASQYRAQFINPLENTLNIKKTN